MIRKNVIVSFTGEHRWLSNFWPAAVRFGGIIFPTVEHAYQAAKSKDFGVRMKIAHASTPALAKRIGGDLTLRKDFPAIRLDVMRYLIARKFEHADLAMQLIATAPMQLQEGNTWGDRFWGVCYGRGENHLGKILMDQRELLVMTGEYHDAMVLAGVSR